MMKIGTWEEALISSLDFLSSAAVLRHAQTNKKQQNTLFNKTVFWESNENDFQNNPPVLLILCKSATGEDDQLKWNFEIDIESYLDFDHAVDDDDEYDGDNNDGDADDADDDDADADETGDGQQLLHWESAPQ